MIKKLKPKSEFSRNVLTLLMGTILAQSIPLAITPILTRLFTPEDFGLFALYFAITSITAVIATGRYEQAIMLPKKDSDAANIVSLTILLTFIFSLLLFIIVFIFNSQISQLVKRPEISSILYLAPISVLFTGVFQALNYWSNRKKQYNVLAISRVARTSSMSTIHLLTGLKTLGALGLIAGDIIGKFVALMLLSRTIKYDKNHLTELNKTTIILQAKRYKKFPTIDTAATLANIGSYQAQNILFPIIYGLASAGQYFLVLRVLQAPLSLVSGALTDVYKQKLTSKETTDIQLKAYYKKMFLFLCGVGIIPFSIFMYFAENIFEFVFGLQWSQAGEYAAILAPMFFIRFIATPLSYFLYLKEKQEINIIGNILLLIVSLVAIYLSKTETQTVLIVSIGFSIIYLGYIGYSAKLARIF